MFSCNNYLQVHFYKSNSKTKQHDQDCNQIPGNINSDVV